MLQRGLLWWTGELGDLLPGGRRATRAPNTDATVLFDQIGSLHLLKARRGLRKAAHETTAADALMRLAKAKPKAKIALQLPFSSCLERSIELPKAARRQARSILNLELERTTPFKAADVLTAFTLSSGPRKGWLTAKQVIVKRKPVERAIREIESLGVRVVHISCADAAGGALGSLNLQAGDAQDRAAGRTFSWAAPAALAVALAVSCVWIGLSRREAALADLDRQLAAERQRTAENVKRTAATQLQGKEAQAIFAFASNRRRAAEIIEDLTRLLPDDVYLESMSLEPGGIEMTGLAASASGIVPLLERSSAFKDVESLAPITFDGTAQKEHFSYRIKVRGEVTSAAITREDGEVAVP